jgi:hypothetical protein
MATEFKMVVKTKIKLQKNMEKLYLKKIQKGEYFDNPNKPDLQGKHQFELGYIEQFSL